MLGELIDLTRLRSVAADPAGIAATAARLQDDLQKRGFDARLLRTAAGAPPVSSAS